MTYGFGYPENAMFGKSSKKRIGLSSFFSADDILVLRGACTRDDAIRKILTRLAYGHDAPELLVYQRDILERETIASTVVSDGLALPHARIDRLQRTYVGVLTSKEGISFDGGRPLVHVVFLALIPTNQPSLYLRILKTLATLLGYPKAIETVSAMATPDEVMRFFEGGGLLLPEQLNAADIMNESFETLKSNQSLKSAIDCFIRTKASEFPVVDDAGDMAGIVTAKSLLNLLLPDCLRRRGRSAKAAGGATLAVAFRNEDEVGISKSVEGGFAAVQMSDPVINVAGAMSRGNTSVCYVLNGKRLVGTIDLPFFLNKLFRE